MNLPEVQLKKILDGVLLAIRKDYLANVNTESNSFLYRLLNGNVSEKWDYFLQGKSIFLRESDNPRLLETRLFFDRSRGGLPCVHITLPNLQSANDGIAMDQGYIDNLDVKSGTSPNFDYISTPIYTRGFQVTYHLIITSDNAFEVLTIYHTLKAALIGNIESLEYYGLRNVKFSGQDLAINENLVPSGIFSRGIGLNLFYEMDIPVFRSIPSVEDITPITGTPIEVDIKVYTITAAVGSGGIINPNMSVFKVLEGSDKTYLITPNSGYHITDVKVDSESVGAVSSYTFNNIVDNHTIEITFALNT